MTALSHFAVIGDLTGLSRKELHTVFDGKPDATPREIADRVRASGRLLAAEAELGTIKAAIAEVDREMRRLCAAADPANDRRLIELEGKRTALISRLAPARRETVALRAERGAEVRRALEASIKASAGRARTAALALQAALADLSAANETLIAASADPLWLAPLTGLDRMIQRLAQLAGRG
ncbi:MAG TPA: hypothetical protein VNF99_09965 [Stellaceae bacterium]|nr:hypothetical protein [Stellaceae bacterium]